MVEDQIRRRGIVDPCVLRAMGRVPRHEFVPDAWRDSAYADRPLPIGFGQTISQPYIVAFMTQALRLMGDERVLEIGTGSGYQAAVLAECAREVYTVEIHSELARTAAARLKELGYRAVTVRHGNGREGWAAHAPYDAIVVTAASPEVPAVLVEQLQDGGILVMPRGPSGGHQVLVRGVKGGNGLAVEELLPVAFVPLVGSAGGSGTVAARRSSGIGELVDDLPVSHQSLPFAGQSLEIEVVGVQPHDLAAQGFVTFQEVDRPLRKSALLAAELEDVEEAVRAESRGCRQRHRECGENGDEARVGILAAAPLAANFW